MRNISWEDSRKALMQADKGEPTEKEIEAYYNYMNAE
jgi:hypothetical protein